MVEDDFNEGTWLPLKRGYSRPLKDRPFVSVRKAGFAFNKAFGELAKLGDFQCVTARYNELNRQVAFLFHNNLDDYDAYPLLRDGGGNKRQDSLTLRQRSNHRSAIMQTGRSIQQIDWLKHVSLEKDITLRRFPPEKIGPYYVINVRPNFEASAGSDTKIPGDVTGIYRLLDENGKCVYVGQGAVASRIRDHRRSGLVFTTTQYSVIDDKEKRDTWERYWIAYHTAEDGSRPKYNLTNGNVSRSK